MKTSVYPFREIRSEVVRWLMIYESRGTHNRVHPSWSQDVPSPSLDGWPIFSCLRENTSWIR